MIDEVAPTGEGLLVLDIGGDVGALVIRAASEYDGCEIHICPVHRQNVHMHNVVRGRRVAKGLTYAAVFPCLQAGDYLVMAPNGRKSVTPVSVVGGKVVDTDWIDTRH
jgi:hypothetical protein